MFNITNVLLTVLRHAFQNMSKSTALSTRVTLSGGNRSKKDAKKARQNYDDFDTRDTRAPTWMVWLVNRVI